MQAQYADLQRQQEATVEHLQEARSQIQQRTQTESELQSLSHVRTSSLSPTQRPVRSVIGVLV
jgi:hypothetical protein